jgi:hypothetical protein
VAAVRALVTVSSATDLEASYFTTERRAARPLSASASAPWKRASGTSKRSSDDMFVLRREVREFSKLISDEVGTAFEKSPMSSASSYKSAADARSRGASSFFSAVDG